jgi:hypothetical protein
MLRWLISSWRRWRARRARAAAFEQLESLLRRLPSARNDHERTRIADEARDVLNALEHGGVVTSEERLALGRDWLGRFVATRMPAQFSQEKREAN